MTIGEFINRKSRPNPDGGIGGLTDAELAPFNDLLNGPRKLCECGETEGSCCSPLTRDPARGPR